MDDDRPYVLETANGAARGAARPLGARRLEPVHVPPRSALGAGHGAPAVAGDPALAGGAGRHAPPRLPVRADDAPVPVRAARPGGGAARASSSTRSAAATSSSCPAARRRAAPARTRACRAGRCPSSSSARSIRSRLRPRDGAAVPADRRSRLSALRGRADVHAAAARHRPDRRRRRRLRHPIRYRRHLPAGRSLRP